MVGGAASFHWSNRHGIFSALVKGEGGAKEMPSRLRCRNNVV